VRIKPEERAEYCEPNTANRKKRAEKGEPKNSLDSEGSGSAREQSARLQIRLVPSVSEGLTRHSIGLTVRVPLRHPHRQPIERRRHTSRELGLEIGVKVVVSQMNEIRALGANGGSDAQ
jgi:hypothetical protein